MGHLRGRSRRKTTWKEDGPPRDAFDKVLHKATQDCTLIIPGSNTRVNGTKVHTWFYCDRVAWKSGKYTKIRGRLRKPITRT